MYFLVNVSPPKRLDVATSNFVAEYWVASNASTMDPDQTDALASMVKLLWSASEYMQQM